jgi:hypothetical protein
MTTEKNHGNRANAVKELHKTLKQVKLLVSENSFDIEQLAHGKVSPGDIEDYLYCNRTMQAEILEEIAECLKKAELMILEEHNNPA